jgi:hypothetical protein
MAIIGSFMLETSRKKWVYQSNLLIFTSLLVFDPLSGGHFCGPMVFKLVFLGEQK